MITNLFFTVENTRGINFDGDETSANYAESNYYRNFARENARLNAYTNQFATQSYNPYIYQGQNAQRRGILNIDQTSKCEALLLDDNKEEIDDTFFEECVKDGSEALIIVNINPNSVDEDLCETLKYWIRTSDGVLKDNHIDSDAKLKSLEGIDIGVTLLNGQIVTMHNCKMVDNYASPKFQYYFAIMTEKITKEK